MSPTPARNVTHQGHLRFWITVIATGIFAGLIGLFCAHLLHFIEWLAWGVTSGTLLEAVTQSSALKRVATLFLGGIIAGISWTLFFHSGPGPTSVREASEGHPMPFLRTLWHAVTQIIAVGMGASIGREVAPRELSSAAGAWLSDTVGLSQNDRRIIVACAAGGGLAAVYSIPLSGAVFSLEVLLLSLRARTVGPAFAVSGIAVLVSTGPCRPAPFYQLPDISADPSLMVWALIFGPILGWFGVLFKKGVDACARSRPHSPHLLWTLPVTFGLVGLLSIWVPSVVGNGQASAQTQFNASWVAGQGLFVAVVVLLSKVCATFATIRAGAWGGTLTPGLAVGAGFGAVTGLLWSYMWPGSSITAFAFIGAAVFLGSSMRAPVTGLVLLMEFTHQGSQLLVPAVIAIGAATAVTSWVEHHDEHAGR